MYYKKNKLYYHLENNWRPSIERGIWDSLSEESI